MFKFFSKQKTVLEKWVSDYRKSAIDDIRLIDKYFKHLITREEIGLIPFINVTADTLIFLPAWSIIDSRKKSKSYKQAHGNEYYTENSAIEISLYLLFYSEFDLKKIN